jgi:hypothetical protein
VEKLLPARAPGVRVGICDVCIGECAEAMADAPTRIPGKARSCSFCRKGEDSVAVMLVLGSELICDECVETYRAAI